MIGTAIGHFRILQMLGAGGMGEVYRARDELLGRDVAIKVLPERFAGDPAARSRLLREARTASRLNHPNICTIHEVGEEAGEAYIAMELVEGETLSLKLNGGPLPVAQVVRFGIQIAEALEHAHGHRVVHRDLKSANVIITPGQIAKVLDFGLARFLGMEILSDASTRSQSAQSEPGVLAGTLAYMAPEQLCGQPADERSDIWSLGIVIYEMAAGHRPFEGRTGFELSSAILNNPLPPLPSRIPAGLRGAIDHLLVKEPGLRYQRAGEVRSALEVLQHAAARRAPRRAPPPASGAKRGAGKACRALAVLPLSNFSRDPEQEYFVDGMTEALIAGLARIRSLKVISRTSIMCYKSAGKPIPEIARELGVDVIVEGSVLKAGDRVRITAQLINAATDTHLWAESYDRELKDVLVLQSEVAHAIAEEIHAVIAPGDRPTPSRLAVHPEAFESYLRGRFHYSRLSREHLGKALEHFRFALEKDPNHAPSYAGLAETWLSLGDCGFASRDEVCHQAKAAALKAVELDDTLPDAHVALGSVSFCYEWNWDEADRQYRRALELDPNSSKGHFFYADYLISLGRVSQWRTHAALALELDPLNFFIQCFHGWHLLYLRRAGEAIPQLRKALLAEPSFSSAHMGLWGAFSQQGKTEEALSEARIFFGLLHDEDTVVRLDHGFAEAGYSGAMRAAAAAMAERATREHVPAIRVARLYAQAGDAGSALAWLETAHARRESPLVHLAAGWDWDCLHGDPRFLELLGRMRLPELNFAS